RDVRIERDWTGDDRWTLRLSGVVDEVTVFGYRLRMERTIEITPGEPVLTIRDTVRNMGGQPSPLMILYHCNIGWPILSPDSELVSPAKKVTPRDAGAEVGAGEWNKMQAPTLGFAEHVFWHEIEPSDKPLSAAILNRPLGLGLEISFDARTLPYLTEWKQMG